MLYVCWTSSILHKIVPCIVQGQRAPFLPFKKLLKFSKISTLKYALSSWFTLNLAGLNLDSTEVSLGQKPHSAVLQSRSGRISGKSQ